MSGGILGLFFRSGNRVSSEQLERMAGAMGHWGPDGTHLWHEENAGLGCLRFINTPEAIHETLPRRMASGQWLAAEARIDNRQELFRRLRVPRELRGEMPDGELIDRAYLEWGEACTDHIYGDWSFAVWDPRAQELFLARDHHGITALYYYVDHRVFAFASDRRALLWLLKGSQSLDDVYLAQILLAWPVYHGERTVYSSIRRLPPAHRLSVRRSGAVQTSRYWVLEETPQRRFRSVDDCVEGLLDVFDEAVRARLRSQRPVGATLSGGLDSGAVVATAAPMLQADDTPLLAFTSVPLDDPAPYTTQRRFGDEWPLAAATARYVGNVCHRPIRAQEQTPLAAVHQMLAIKGEPQHAASNAFWMIALLRAARSADLGVLLTGQEGNATISWSGVDSTWRGYLRHLWPRRWRQNALFWLRRLLAAVPHPLLRAHRIRKLRRGQAWLDHTALNPSLAQQIEVLDRSIDDVLHPINLRYGRGTNVRLNMLAPGRSLIGAKWAEMGAAFGLEVRDPTADPRLLRYCLSIPDHWFVDPHTGTERYLIRRAMQDRLPEEVRQNTRKGLQAADIVPRLRREAPAVTRCLEEFAAGPAADYLDLPKVADAWQTVQREESPSSMRQAVVILMRGVMAGQFVQQGGSMPALQEIVDV